MRKIIVKVGDKCGPKHCKETQGLLGGWWSCRYRNYDMPIEKQGQEPLKACKLAEVKK